jgi:hypothetical protein
VGVVCSTTILASAVGAVAVVVVALLGSAVVVPTVLADVDPAVLGPAVLGIGIAGSTAPVAGLVDPEPCPASVRTESALVLNIGGVVLGGGMVSMSQVGE